MRINNSSAANSAETIGPPLHPPGEKGELIDRCCYLPGGGALLPSADACGWQQHGTHDNVLFTSRFLLLPAIRSVEKIMTG